jgi:hypothetical protein
VVNHKEVSTLDEEDTNQDQDPVEEEIQAEEATVTGTENSATSAKSKDTDKRSVGNKSRRTNRAVTHKDEITGPGSTSWMKTRTPRPSTPFTMRMSGSATKTVHLTLPEFNIDQEPQPFPAIFGFSEKSWMTPLIQAPSVIPQLILSLCTVSIATCKKLFENMMPFNGDNNKPKILGTVNGKSQFNL